jgi:hypothetical protein
MRLVVTIQEGFLQITQLRKETNQVISPPLQPAHSNLEPSRISLDWNWLIFIWRCTSPFLLLEKRDERERESCRYPICLV